MKTPSTVRVLVVAAAAACVALPSMAAGNETKNAMPESSATMPAPVVANSDRERMTLWTDQKQRLEAALRLGDTKAGYRKALSDQGYMITSVNADKPDYIEYEIVKGLNSYEVQIELDKTGKGSKVDVATNIWHNDTTKNALRGNRLTQEPRYQAANSLYSDRTRMTQWTSDKTKLEQALGKGKSVAQYRAELEQMGYQITATNEREKDYVELEVVRGQDSYEVQIDLDATGKGDKVDVAANLWKADATEKALDMNKK